jgi:Amt family ammonium transporter
MVNFTYTQENNILVPGVGTDGADVIYNEGDAAWVLASTALVMIMTPGLGFFYSGLLRRKNALSQIYLSLAIFAIVSFQWFFWGYSLAFAPGSKFIGDLTHFGLINVLEKPSPGSSRIPAILFCVYQCMFATITPAIAIGATAERGRIGPAMLFAFIWATIVYDPIACWTWNPNGWAFQLGTLDFAGGGPVHMSSGAAALAYSIWLGRRKGYGTDKLNYKPHNVSHVALGTIFLWFGWFGFNGGSALSATFRAAQASIVTNLAASVGGLTWTIMDYRFDRKWSAVGFCSGAIAGLVAITPAAGYVGSPAAVAIGVLGACGANLGTKLKFYINADETLDIFASHGIGGLIGSLCTGIFADSRVAGFDGTVIPGGWINHHYIQLAYQLADSVAILSYSFVVTMIILVVLDHIPGCSMRASEEAEVVGIDHADMGEWGYDYAYVDRDIEGNGPEATRLYDQRMEK